MPVHQTQFPHKLHICKMDHYVLVNIYILQWIKGIAKAINYKKNRFVGPTSPPRLSLACVCHLSNMKYLSKLFDLLNSLRFMSRKRTIFYRGRSGN